MRKLSLVLSCTCILLLQACQNYEDIRDIDRIDHQPEIAVPLFNADLSVEEVLDEYGEIDFLKIATDGSMSLNYSQEQVQKQAADLIPAMEDFPIVLIDSFMSVPVQFFDKLDVTKIGLQNGTISFDIQSSHTEDISIRISFPKMLKDGVPFEIQTTLDYQGSAPFATTISPQSIEAYELFMPGGLLEVRYEAYNSMGERVLLDQITGLAENWEYSDIEGVWANETFDIISDTIKVDLFENWTQGQVNFEDPKLIIDLNNSIGFPVQLALKNMTAHTVDGDAIPISSVFNDGYNLSFPALNQMGQTTSDQIILDKTNSNIISIFNANPQYITYELTATINPSDDNIPGFILTQSEVRGAVTVDVPIYGTASGFTFESDAEFDLNDSEEVNHVELKLITNNSIPVDLELQVYFTDDNNQVIDSLFENQKTLLTAPDVAANGTVIDAAEQTSLIQVSVERFKQIQQASQVKLKAAISTANEGETPVKLLEDQKVEVRMGAIIGFE